MPKRELRVVGTDVVVGTVDEERGDRFTGHAVHVFTHMCDRLGADEAARQLIADGWSNGYLYLAEVS